MKLSTTLRVSTLAALAFAASAAHAELIYGVTATNLVTFDSATPASFTTGATITGIVAGHTLRGIDFRPATGDLYAVSSNTTTGRGQVYTVNLTTGALTTVGADFALAGTSTRVSLDFNPVADRLRIIDGNNNNLRMNPNDGSVIVDTSLTWAPGDAHSGGSLIADFAYSNNVVGATSTTLYGYEFNNDVLVNINPPNSGVMNTIGPTAPFSAFSGAVGFDISGATGVGYVVGDNGASAGAASELFTVNLATGAMTQVGADDILTGVTDLSVRPTGTVPEPATLAVFGLGALGLLRRRRRA